MASTEQILETLGMLASKAEDPQLAEDLRAFVAQRNGTTPATPPAAGQQPESAQADDEVEAPLEIQDDTETDDTETDDHVGPLAGDLTADPIGDPAVDFTGGPVVGLPDGLAEEFPDFDVEGLGGLADAINGIGNEAARAATPRSMTLTIVPADAQTAPAQAEAANTIAATVLPSLVAAIGPVEIGEVAVGEAGTTVVLNLTDDNDGTALAIAAQQANLLAENTLFEDPGYPYGETDTYVVKGVAAEVEDIDLARQLGLAIPADAEIPEIPAVAEGEHPINGLVDMIEEQTGYRPEAVSLKLVFMRVPAGTAPHVAGLRDMTPEQRQEIYRLPELTATQVETIVAHRRTQSGLTAMGNMQLMDVTDIERHAEDHEAAGPVRYDAYGDEIPATVGFPQAKTAHFGVLGTGRINPALIGMAVHFGGTWDFGGEIGTICCWADVVHAEAPQHAF